VQGKRNRFEIIVGERRFQAMKLLEKNGELPEDYEFPAEVRDGLSKDDALRVENLQRPNMTPLERTAALTKLVHKGVMLDNVVAQTGLSASTIKRRLALATLCAEAKEMLTKGDLTLSQAEALTWAAARRRSASWRASGREENSPPTTPSSSSPCKRNPSKRWSSITRRPPRGSI
jgi:ParB family chromosome partitioning protein